LEKDEFQAVAEQFAPEKRGRKIYGIKAGSTTRLASKTVTAGRAHLANVLQGEETLAEAAGLAVQDVLSGKKTRTASGNKTKRAAKSSAKKSIAKGTTAGKKGRPATKKSSRKKA